MLYWRECIDKSKVWKSDSTDQQILDFQTQIKLADIKAKLTTIKNAIVEILAEHRDGKVPLAQLPMYMRNKLPFALDYNYLGFAKLQDLILSMDGSIKVELKGHNHPFVYLVKSNRYVHNNSKSDDHMAIPERFGLLANSRLSMDIPQSKFPNPIIDENLQQILVAFYEMLKQNPMGIS